MKQCSKCKEWKELEEFDKNLFTKDGLRFECKQCRKIYRDQNKISIIKWQKDYHQKYPWKQIFNHIKQRCNNLNDKAYKWYGGRGIKCLITEEEIKKLWFKDKAFDMKRPSIDREDNNDNYCIENCRFIEMVENSKKDKNKPVLQYDLQGNFIREWKSGKEAGEELKINKGHLCECMQRKLKTCGGYIWRYKTC